MLTCIGCADEGSRESVDAKCKQLTASWVREKHVSNPEIEVCDFYETLEAAGADAVLEPGVYTLQVPDCSTLSNGLAPVEVLRCIKCLLSDVQQGLMSD